MNAIAINHYEQIQLTPTIEQSRPAKAFFVGIRILGRAFAGIGRWFAARDLSLEEWERIESHPRSASRISESRRWL